MTIDDNGTQQEETIFDDLLRDETEEQTLEPKVQNADGNGSKGDTNPTVVDLKAKYEKLETSYKNQQEFLRQRNEDIKDLRAFKDKLTGADETKKQEILEKEMNERFEETPLPIIQKMIQEKIGEVKSELEKTRAESTVKDVMKEIDSEYGKVDWNKHFPKIVSKAGYFSDKAKREMPKEVLLQACRMAGVNLEKKSKESPVYIEGAGGSMPPEAIKKEAQSIKAAILAQKPKDIFKLKE